MGFKRPGSPRDVLSSFYYAFHTGALQLFSLLSLLNLLFSSNIFLSFHYKIPKSFFRIRICFLTSSPPFSKFSRFPCLHEFPFYVIQFCTSARFGLGVSDVTGRQDTDNLNWKQEVSVGCRVIRVIDVRC